MGRLDGIDGGVGLVDKRLGLRQVAGAALLLGGDPLRVGLAPGLDASDLLALRLGLGRTDLEPLEHPVRAFRRLLELDLLGREDHLHGLDVRGALDELVQPELDPSLLLLERLELLAVHGLVGGDEAQVALGRLVHLPPHAVEVLRADVRHHLVDHPHVRHEGRLDLVGAVEGKVLDEPVAYADQGLLGPSEEPVDRGAADQAGELAGADGELGVHRGHAEDDVEVVPDAVREELLHVVGRLLLTGTLPQEILPQVRRHGHHLVLGEQARDLARGQDGVDRLEEDLVLDLALREEERRGLALVARVLVQGADVVHQRRPVVLLR